MDLREAIRTQPMSRLQMTTVAICFILAMIDGFEILIMSFGSPHLGKDWGIGSVEIGYLLSAGLLGIALGAILLSPLADRIGRRALSLCCLGIMTIGMGLSAIAVDVPQLVAFRIVAGLGLGGLVANLGSLVSEYSSGKRRATLLGFYGLGLPVGSAIGGAISGVLISHYGWRSAFVFGTAITAVVLVVAWRSLPESIDFLVEKRPAHALRRYNAIGAKLGYPAAAELPGRSLAVDNPMREGLFRGIMLRRTILLWAGFSLLIAAFYFANTWTPKLIADATGNTDLGVTTGVLVSMGGIVGGLLYSLLTLVVRPRIVVTLMLAAGAGIYVVYANVLAPPWLAMVVAVLVGLCANGGIVATTRSVRWSIPPRCAAPDWAV